MNDQDGVRLDVDGRIAILTIDRSHARNAIDRQMASLLARMLDTVADAADVHVVIITGAGEQAFSAGADLHEMQGWRRDDGLADERKKGDGFHQRTSTFGPKAWGGRYDNTTVRYVGL
jgi:enoyl-CoA hydratase/carnithine racemase